MKPQDFSTRDTKIAAALIAKGLKMLSMQQEGKDFYFYFEDGNLAKQYEHEYLFGELLVNAREFIEAKERIGDRIFEIRRSQ